MANIKRRAARRFLIAAVLLDGALAVQSRAHDNSLILHRPLEARDVVALVTPVKLEAAPGIFCLDLNKTFDIHRIEAMAAPVQVTQKFSNGD